MARDASAEERLIAELELALQDPEQRQRLVDFFLILQEWSLEEKSSELSRLSEPQQRDTTERS